VAAIATEDADFRNARAASEGDQAAVELASLAQSIAETGLLHPVVVVETTRGRYLLVAGFRRLAAVKRLGWTEIPATVLSAETSLLGQKWVNLVENHQRKTLTPFELAKRAVELVDQHQVTHAEIARRLGYSESHVANLARFFRRLPSSVLKDWEKGDPRLTFSLLDRLAQLGQEEADLAWLQAKGLAPKGPRVSDKPRGPIRRATILSLIKVEHAIHENPALDERTKWLLVAVVHFAQGTRKEIPGIYDGAVKRRLRRIAARELAAKVDPLVKTLRPEEAGVRAVRGA
jgi:ParB/RepB/Spo0J family partition protein